MLFSRLWNVLIGKRPSPSPTFAENYQSKENKDLGKVIYGLLWAIGLGLALVVLHNLATLLTRDSGSVTIPLLWASACLAVGGLVGFLFGIPRVLQAAKADAETSRNGPSPDAGKPPAGREPAEPARKEDASTPGAAPAAPAPKTPAASADPESGYSQLVNTNLEQISDWLTKIIVGLGLIELRNIPGHVDAAAERLAADMGTPGARSFAAALLVYFSVLGFLYGYLVTRLFLAGAFSRADRAALDLREQLRDIRDIAKRVERTVTGTGDGNLPPKIAPPGTNIAEESNPKPDGTVKAP